MSKKRIMINGAMQSGKTEYTVRTALENQEPKTIEVFIHYSTNDSMASTNEKINRYDVELFSGLESL
jgi:predicted AAA+ superfamily ATPase